MSINLVNIFSDNLKRFLLSHTPWVLNMHPSVRGSHLSLNSERDRFRIVDRDREIWVSRKNAVYVPDMFTSFDYYFNAVEPFLQSTDSGFIKIVDYSTPRIHNVSGFHDFPVHCPSLVEPYQTCEQYLEFAQLNEGQTVLDLGCYSGLTAIAFSKAVRGAGRVVSVEPDPTNFRASEKNLDLHHRFGGFNNVTLLPLAVSGSTGVLTFSSEGSMGSSAVSMVGGYRGSVSKIPCMTLEDLVTHSGLNRVDFIKMDIEGSEIDVVQSSEKFFQKHRPRMIIEPHLINGRLNAPDIMNCLSGYGYRCQIIEQYGVHLPLVTAIPE